MTQLYYGNNVDVLTDLLSGYNEPFVDCIYADCIYEDWDVEVLWVDSAYDCLKENGIFFVQTDYHTVAEYKLYLDDLFGKENFINWLIYIQEWGGTSKRYFPKK